MSYWQTYPFCISEWLCSVAVIVSIFYSYFQCVTFTLENIARKYTQCVMTAKVQNSLIILRGWGTAVCTYYWETYFKHITSSYGQFTVTMYKCHTAKSTMPITWTKTVSKSNYALLICITCTRASGTVPSLTYCTFDNVCRHSTTQYSTKCTTVTYSKTWVTYYLK